MSIAYLFIIVFIALDIKFTFHIFLKILLEYQL